jgi:hypothetical protein
MALYVTVITAEFGICIVTSVADRRWWIRIQEAKPMHIHADPVPDPGQTLLSQKVGFDMKNVRIGKRPRVNLRRIRILI